MDPKQQKNAEPTAGKDPLDRLAVLEQQRDEALEREGKLTAALAERDTRLAALEERVQNFEAEKAARRQAEVESYLGELQQQATELQQPLAADNLQQVRDLFDKGWDSHAKALGDALLSGCEARAASAGSKVAPTRIGASVAVSEAERAELQASMLRAAGVKAEVVDGRLVHTPNRIAL